MYDMKIEHRPGVQHKNADSLSRIPCKHCKFDPKWESNLEKLSKVNKATGLAESTETYDYGETSLVEIQKVDKEISTVRKWIEDQTKPKQQELCSGGPILKGLWSQREMLVIENDLLCRAWEDQKGRALQAIVPLKERRKVLSFSHDHPTAGRFGN